MYPHVSYPVLRRPHCRTESPECPRFPGLWEKLRHAWAGGGLWLRGLWPPPCSPVSLLQVSSCSSRPPPPIGPSVAWDLLVLFGCAAAHCPRRPVHCRHWQASHAIPQICGGCCGVVESLFAGRGSPSNAQQFKATLLNPPEPSTTLIRGRFCTAPHTAPNSDRTANHSPLGELRPQGKNSRFRQQSGVFSANHALVYLIVSENLCIPVSGNTVVTAVTLAIGENGSKIVDFSHSAGTAHGAEQPPRVCVVDSRVQAQVSRRAASSWGLFGLGTVCWDGIMVRRVLLSGLLKCGARCATVCFVYPPKTGRTGRPHGTEYRYNDDQSPLCGAEAPPPSVSEPTCVEGPECFDARGSGS